VLLSRLSLVAFVEIDKIEMKTRFPERHLDNLSAIEICPESNPVSVCYKNHEVDSDESNSLCVLILNLRPLRDIRSNLSDSPTSD